jgi:hypothetical protein
MCAVPPFDLQAMLISISGVALAPRAANTMLHTPSTNWSFTKLFSDGEFIAAGQVCVRPGCEKPLKNVKDNTYVRAIVLWKIC